MTSRGVCRFPFMAKMREAEVDLNQSATIEAVCRETGDQRAEVFIVNATTMQMTFELAKKSAL